MGTDIILTTLLISALSLSPEVVNLFNERRIPLIASRPKHVREVLHFNIEGMKCKACANNVKTRLEAVSPTCKAVVVQEERRAEILCEGAPVDPSLFIKAVFQATDPAGDFVATFIKRETANDESHSRIQTLSQLLHAPEEEEESEEAACPAVSS